MGFQARGDWDISKYCEMIPKFENYLKDEKNQTSIEWIAEYDYLPQRTIPT